MAPDIICAYKMASYTLRLLKKFAARPRGEGFFIAKGEAKNLASRKQMRLFALTMAAPDLISESLQWTSGYRVRSRNDKHMVNKEQMVNKETNVRPRDSPTDLLMYRAHGEWIWRTYGGRAWGSMGSLPARNRAQSSKHG